ncbi:hypothetical protein LCGC14_0117680 [marine sediment metagenome]|uniref:Uncharacterized protein n=1 Tax=marine sediment metagenome TaxID=412755 RepID=A0A0F9V7D2_9ZZZZ|nr:hypothetical protein [Maribacter sp.]HDZ07275.1 hypothetical protein [Maribacter sp.]
MKSIIKHIAIVVFVISSSLLNAQETLNANDTNTFIFGGDQQTNTLSVELLPIAIVDVEPDPSTGISGSADLTSLEAGLPFTGAADDLDGLWLNFTHRAENFQNARIFVSTNQPVPAGMSVNVEIIATGTGGDFPSNPRVGQVNLSTTEEVIVYDFANGYTGDGLNNGYQLKYTIDNPGAVSLPDGFEIIYRIQ